MQIWYTLLAAAFTALGSAWVLGERNQKFVAELEGMRFDHACEFHSDGTASSGTRALDSNQDLLRRVKEIEAHRWVGRKVKQAAADTKKRCPFYDLIALL